MSGSRARLLPVVIMALGAFGALKLSNIWFGFSAANAQQEAMAPNAPSAMQPEAEAASEKPAHQDVPAPDIPPGGVERRILEQLAERRAALDEREEKLATREAVIAAAEKRLDDRIAKFEDERVKLAALREKKDADKAKEIASIVSAYEKMKAKDAAAIFDELDEDILVPVAAGMRTQALAGVLAEMKPDNARNLTRLLAQRTQDDSAPAAAPSAASREQ